MKESTMEREHAFLDDTFWVQREKKGWAHAKETRKIYRVMLELENPNGDLFYVVKGGTAPNAQPVVVSATNYTLRED